METSGKQSYLIMDQLMFFKTSQLYTSVGPGNPVYSAPEAPFPDYHSPAMDV